ncbi:hypothetical protein GDO78_019761 [Eleutherodactylus coqui]|uniref:Uncharacterized protein n=1 Tax=Eleutherodactylus coqui TaxID=57060 RepID=A0A8J6B5P1_ELECQ|nr:hypothetical protein GDO78_019761 [Eleutherodactylus coqui]
MKPLFGMSFTSQDPEWTSRGHKSFHPRPSSPDTDHWRLSNIEVILLYFPSHDILVLLLQMIPVRFSLHAPVLQGPMVAHHDKGTEIL